VEDQDKKTPEEEPDVQGHAQDELSDEMYAKKDDDDDVEAHAIRDELSDEMYAKDELSDELA
jgi:hypothetical protein